LTCHSLSSLATKQNISRTNIAWAAQKANEVGMSLTLKFVGNHWEKIYHLE